MKLYDLERDKNIKIYGAKAQDTGEDIVIIFGHLDGMYSYCWIEDEVNGDTDKVVHLSASTPLTAYKDGYKIDGGA